MRNTIILIITLFIASSCNKEEFVIDNLNSNQIGVFGHGGMGIGQTYPINSFESLAKSLNIGADGTELDVQVTKDGVLVAFHDQYLDDDTRMSGQIIDKKWNELSDATYTTPPYTSYQVISLDELFTNLNRIEDFTFTFDCKLFNSEGGDINAYFEVFANAIEEISAKYNLKDNLFIESSTSSFLKLLQKQNKNYKLFIQPRSFEEGLEIAKNMNLFGITISTTNITKEQINRAHDAGLFIAVWNTHTKDRNVEAVNKNPDFIQTDKVKHLVNLLR